jgi:hypothetical protein
MKFFERFRRRPKSPEEVNGAQVNPERKKEKESLERLLQRVHKERKLGNREENPLKQTSEEIAKTRIEFSNKIKDLVDAGQLDVAILTINNEKALTKRKDKWRHLLPADLSKLVPEDKQTRDEILEQIAFFDELLAKTMVLLRLDVRKRMEKIKESPPKSE